MTYNQPKVHYERIDHLVTQQNETEARFLAQFDAGDYTIDAPMIVENPYLINPLAALVQSTAGGHRASAARAAPQVPAQRGFFKSLLDKLF